MPLTFSPFARLDLRLEVSHEIIGALKPAIVDLASRVAQGSSIAAAAARTFERFPSLAPWFEGVAADANRAFGLRSEILYPQTDRLMRFCAREVCHDVTLDFDTSSMELGGLRELIGRLALGAQERRAIARAAGEPFDQILTSLLDAGLVVPAEAQTERRLSRRRPGLARLQHASLAVSTNLTRLLIDPHFGSMYVPANLEAQMRAADWIPNVDGILVSHGHADHWDLPSILMAPPHLPIVVPHVPRASILSDDLAARLRSLGFQHVHDGPWYSSAVTIGDITIWSYPFYGEQPLASAALRSADLRNWGNTYYIGTPYFSAWIIVDAGDDAVGGMLQVAERIARDHGGVDFLASNLRDFIVGESPTYVTGTGSYWLALTPDQMMDFPRFGRERLTLGPDGVAEVAVRCRARYVLPYAHWWREPSQADASEEQLVRALHDAIGGRGPQVIPWNIGETVLPSGVRSSELHVL